MFISCNSLTKIYKGIESNINNTVLKSIDFSVPKYSFTGIFGPSGSGKSTLLKILAGFLTFEAGSVTVDNIHLNDLSVLRRSRYWSKKIGLIHQFPSRNVFPLLTIEENLNLVRKRNSKKKIIEILKSVNLINYQNRVVQNLSGGEVQRLAIAINLIRGLPLILADEPTGELDSMNTLNIFKLLKKLVKQKSFTCIVVSHDYSLMEYCDYKFFLENGQIKEF